MDFSLNETERDLVGLCREFAQTRNSATGATGMGGGPLPDRPAARNGRPRPARHARPRAVGRHRHVDRRLRRRHGADRSGRPVRRRCLAGPRHHRLAPLAPLRERRPARALAAPARRRPGAGRLRAHRARCWFRRAWHYDPGGTARRRVAHQRAQDLHLQRRDRHVVRRHPAGAHGAGRRRRAGLRQPGRREGHARLHHGPENARHRLARPRHPRALPRRRLGARRAPARRSEPGARPVPAYARSRTDLHCGALAQPDPGRPRPGHGLRAASARSSGSPFRNSRRCSSNWPTSPPSSRRLAG